MAERGLSVDHVTIWRWVQRYAPILNQRIRRELRSPNRSWRVDETVLLQTQFKLIWYGVS
jgi:transposase-like protein